MDMFLEIYIFIKLNIKSKNRGKDIILKDFEILLSPFTIKNTISKGTIERILDIYLDKFRLILGIISPIPVLLIVIR